MAEVTIRTNQPVLGWPRNTIQTTELTPFVAGLIDNHVVDVVGELPPADPPADPLPDVDSDMVDSDTAEPDAPDDTKPARTRRK